MVICLSKNDLWISYQPSKTPKIWLFANEQVTSIGAFAIKNFWTVRHEFGQLMWISSYRNFRRKIENLNFLTPKMYLKLLTLRLPVFFCCWIDYIGFLVYIFHHYYILQKFKSFRAEIDIIVLLITFSKIRKNYMNMFSI